MAKVRINCPFCKTWLGVSGSQIGKKRRCERCGEQFVISQTEDNQKPASPEKSAQSELQAIHRSKAKLQQESVPGIVDTIATSKDVGNGIEIARTIASPQKQGPEKTYKVEQDVTVEWEEGQTILDIYEVKQVHKTGGMGLVYRVHHKNWNMDLAVKSPRTDYFKTEAHKENFTRECETWIDLGLHPNIVSCFYVRTLGGIPRIFAEYVEGGSLKDWIDDKKLYEGGKERALERILDIAIQFAWGLHYAHEKGVVHQDVKPANVMIAEDGTAKITDFGLAKARAGVGEATATDAHQSILVSSGGMTPAYCSPEQASKQSLSCKTDIWSWGLSVLEMFAGEVFWRAGQAAPEALDSFLQTGAEDESIPEMPGGLAELLKQCFEHNPDDRPKDMQEVSAKLMEIYESTIGQQYELLEPEPTDLLADSLNNKALSMLDIGKHEEALRILNEALRIETTNLEVTFNLSLLQWRDGKVDDCEVLRRLNNCGNNPEIEKEKLAKLKAFIYAESFNPEASKESLKEFPGEYDTLFSGKDISQISQVGSLSRIRLLNTGVFSISRTPYYVNSVAITPDGRFAVCGFLRTGGVTRSIDLSDITSDKRGALDKTLQVWNLQSERLSSVMGWHNSGVNSISITRDGRFAVSGSSDKTLKMWELESGQCILTMEGHTSAVSSVAFTPDGRFAVSGSWDETLKVWDLQTGHCIRTMEGHPESVYTVAITPNNKFAISGSVDKTLKMWELESGRCIHTMMGHRNHVLSVAIMSNSMFAVSGSRDATLKMWDLEMGQCVRTMRGHNGSVESVAVTPDSRYAVSRSNDEFKVWELESSRCIRTMKGYIEGSSFRRTYTRESLALTPDGGFAVSVSGEDTLKLYAIKCNKAYRAQPMVSIPKSFRERKAEEDALNLAVSQAEVLYRKGDYKNSYSNLYETWKAIRFSNREVIAKLYANFVRKGKMKDLHFSYQVKLPKGHTDCVTSLAITPDSRLAISGSRDTILKVWDLEACKCIHTIKGHISAVESLSLTPEGRYAVSGSWDTILKVWDLETGQCIRTMEGHNPVVTSIGLISEYKPDTLKSLALTPDGRLVVSGSFTERETAQSPDYFVDMPSCGISHLKMWDLETGDCIHTLEGHSGCINSISITPDGRVAVSGSSDKTLKIWELATGQCIRTMEGHTSNVNTVVLTPDGRFAVSGSSDKTLKMWELETGQCTRTMEGHTANVNTAALTPDGRYVLSGSGDSTLKVWNMETGQCIHTMEGHTGAVISVDVASSCMFAVSGSEDRTLRIWRLIWDLEFPEPADWDEGAASYLKNFLVLHCPYGDDGISRVGKPEWNEDDFNKLLDDLQLRGFGWLRPEGVRKKLEEMMANWQGPPPLPGQ